MNAPRNSVTLTLMLSSIVLLIGLQAAWLINVYEKEFVDFRKETSTLLKSAVIAQWDVVMESHEPIHLDSIEKFRRVMVARDSERSVGAPGHDSLKAGPTLIVSHTLSLDSTNKMIRIPKIDQDQKFVIRFGPDTLSIDTLSMYFKNSLNAAGIHSQFQIEPVVMRMPELDRLMNDFNRTEDTTNIKAFSDTLVTEIAKFGSPRHGYIATFPGMHSYLLRQITPQVSFALLLSVIVSTAFLVTYQGLRQQQKLNTQKNDFISNVTHELKTPLATVSVALEALKNFHGLDDPKRTKEYLDIAQNELQRLTLMTDKILKASVFETQGVSFVPEKVNLDIIIEKILSSLKLVFEKNETRVVYVPVGKNFSVSGSEIHLTNVIYNLLDNALKYGSNQSTIDLQLKDTEAFLEFSIRDQGIGIAKEYQKKIFEKFFRIPTGDVHNVKGYGLGLNYVARVVEKHGGHIDVESEPGKGSLFKIKLPKQSGGFA